jgi:hypothetical protein
MSRAAWFVSRDNTTGYLSNGNDVRVIDANHLSHASLGKNELNAPKGSRQTRAQPT